MSKINKLCIKVLKYTKEHNMKVSEEDFQKICGKQTDAVFAELHGKKIGTYISGYKSIWSISPEKLESSLSNYKSFERGEKGLLWKWVIGLIVSVAGVIAAFLGISH